ncbi:MAG: hypothetical protein COX17_09720 [Deltaproteobacteria bacterium CG23_combo_of_CG06-09_8_20_14_all_60_8]|nr:MAG: hypothetical protein AUK28_00805 [Desulfobacterales bacterium CG2_30_60_27]PIP42952.1 MAG: hypothetical protein COX17_09720 [Deltaproteobacteria bacterium CG23_combo_of_CG06-09_8_20_14_all_60_8]
MPAPHELASPLRNVGIVGVPPLEVIRRLNRDQVRIYDLDEPLVQSALETTAPFVPRVYCAVLRTVVQNALQLDLDAIFVDVGPGKCDSAGHIATILADVLGIPIIRTINEDQTGFGTPICDSGLPLLEKLQRITAGVACAAPPAKIPPPCPPTAAFWGVPPRDFSILRLFPDTTHVYGWTRCMENKTPADERLEGRYNPTIPTVFFAQSFCAKTALAQFLANRHPHALYLDADVAASNSTKAKIQAFLELSGVPL